MHHCLYDTPVGSGICAPFSRRWPPEPVMGRRKKPQRCQSPNIQCTPGSKKSGTLELDIQNLDIPNRGQDTGTPYQKTDTLWREGHYDCLPHAGCLILPAILPQRWGSRAVLSGLNRFSGYAGHQKLHHYCSSTLWKISCVASQKSPLIDDLPWFIYDFNVVFHGFRQLR